MHPGVLVACAAAPTEAGERLFDARSLDVRRVCGASGEHLVVDHCGEPIRIDVVDGTTMAGPVVLRFHLADDDRLEHQFAAIRALRNSAAPRRHLRLARRLLALQATDAYGADASLREIADLVLGPGDWPGDGEHRKSCVRRLLVQGRAMLHAGARAILMDM